MTEDWDESEAWDEDYLLCQACKMYFLKWHFFNNQYCPDCVYGDNLVYDKREDAWYVDWNTIDLG